MKRWRYVVAVLCLVCGSAVLARPELAGTWQGELAVSESTRILVEFVIEKGAGESYSAVMNAPTEPSLQNIPVSSLTLTGDEVRLQVDEVSGAFQGSFQGESLVGHWRQQGQEFPLTLAPYVEEPLSEELIQQISGEWHGLYTFEASGRSIHLVLHFEATDGGLGASFDSPDQGIAGIPVADVHVGNGKITLNIAQPRVTLRGDLEGDRIIGEWVQNGSTPIVFQKGAYEFPTFDLPAAVGRELVGSWHGELGGQLTLVINFVETADGSIRATLDSPDQGVSTIPITRIEASGGEVVLNADGIGMQIEATVADGGLNGTFRQKGQVYDLTMSRGEFVAGENQVTAMLAKKLLGTWQGEAGGSTMIMHFSYDGAGRFLALLDIPDRKLSDLPISGISQDGARLSMIVRGIAAEFEGQINAESISGEWTMPSLQFPVEFKQL